jgi:eukaryotic-like serine/threonine-protein kinase
MTHGPQAPTVPETGTGEDKPVVGGFTLRWQIGQGAEGTIWAARHEVSGEPAAVKILKSTGETALFEREVRAVAGLNHPHIVRVFDYGTIPEEAAEHLGSSVSAGDPYLAMELAARGTLEDIAQDLDWHRLATVVHAVLDAFAHAHARGVIHRDVKPGNILLTAEVTGAGVRLSDFGIVHLQHPDEERPEGFAGTPRYAAPEQYMADWRLWGPWTDLYALGAVIWKMTTGKPLFVGNFMQLMHQHLDEDPGEFLPRFAVPRGLEGWLRRMLAKAPEDRFQFAAEAREGLEAVESEALASEELRGFVSMVDPDAVPDLMRVEEAPDTVPVTLRSAPLALREIPADWRELSAPRPDHLHGAGLGLYALRDFPFVGREVERDLLWGDLCKVAVGDGVRVVVLRGPSGLGKSRLATWLTRRAHELGAAHVAMAHHQLNLPRGQGLRRALAAMFGCEDLSLRKTRKVVRDWMDVDDDADDDVVDDIAELLADPRGGDRLQSASARHQAALHLLAERTRTRPAIICLDDAQWDDDAIHFALAALDARQPIRALFVITVQEEGLAHNRRANAALLRLAQSPQTSQIPIGTMDAAGQRALVRELLGLSDQLVDTVCTLTDGSPLFAVQLVGEWVSRGAIRFGKRGFELREGARLDVPDGLQGLILGRFGGFDDAELAALELAACVEGEVDNAIWQTACDARGYALEPAVLMRLFRARLAEPAQAGWRFAHSTLSRTLERRARDEGRIRAHHLSLSQAYAQLGDTSPAALIVSAHHLAEAGEARAAEIQLWQATDSWEDRGDHLAVLAALDRLEALLDARSAPPECSERRRLALARGWHLTILSQVERGFELLDWVIETAQTMPRDDLVRDGLMYRGWNRYRASDAVAARRDLREALAAYAKVGNEARHAECARYLAHAVVPLPDGSTRARQLFETALAGAGDNHSLRGQALLGIANLEGDAGDWGRAIALAEAGRAAFVLARKPLDLAVCDAFLGNVQIFREDYDAALLVLQRAISGLIRVGVPPHVTQSIAAMCLALMGRGDEALGYAASALSTRRKAISQGWVCICFAVRAHVAAARGDAEGWDNATNELDLLLPQQWRSTHEILQLLRASLPQVEARWPSRAQRGRAQLQVLWDQLLRSKTSDS